jgi:hypothetical protein
MRAEVEYIELRKRWRAGVDQCRDERAGLRDYPNDHGSANECATFDGFCMLLVTNRKPAVIAKTNEWVAAASESQARSGLPDGESARVWEPDPEVIYAWSR